MAHPTKVEVELNHRIVDDLDPDGGGPIDWGAMPPIELWDAETDIIRVADNVPWRYGDGE